MDSQYFVQSKTLSENEWKTYGGDIPNLTQAIGLGWASYFCTNVVATRIVGMDSLRVVAEFYPNWDIKYIPEVSHLLDIEAQKKLHIKQIL